MCSKKYKITLRYRDKIVKKGYKDYWGNKIPPIAKRLYLYYDMNPELNQFEELEMRELVKRLTFDDMGSNSAFWNGYFGRKDTLEFRKKYKKQKIYIKETSDGKWVRV